MQDDQQGKLTKEDRDHIQKWLADRGITNEMKCPVCHQPGWFLAEHLVQPVTLIHREAALGGVAYPQAMMISETCGFTVYFNAVAMGLVSPRGGRDGQDK